MHKSNALVITLWLALTGTLVSCGGGGGGGGGAVTAPAVACAPFLDSFGQTVTCAQMSALPGAELPYLEGGGGGDGGGGDGGADGGAGDGAPIANTELQFTDINGKVVKTRTDATGYYRISLRGLKAPLVATVLRESKPWKSMLVTDIVRAPANRKFYTINLTGLTDYVVSEVAKKDGLSTVDAITPAAVVRQKAQIPGIISAINASLSTQITAVGLNPSSFNPLTQPFKAVLTDSYDKLLESVLVTRNPTTGATEVNPAFALGGTVSGLGTASGLSLRNANETIPVAANATAFTFATKLAQNSTYNVTIASQPSGLTCAVNRPSGTMGTAAVTDVAVVCSPITFTIGGVVAGLGSASGLQLGNAGQTLVVAPNQTSFTFSPGVVQGANYSVAVQAQPPGLTCSVSSGSGTMGAAPVSSVQVNCSVNSFSLGGSITGLTANGLVLTGAGQTLGVASGSSSFAFATPVATGSSYVVAVQSQPTNLTCSVANGSGTVSNSAVNSVTVSCTPNRFAVGGTVAGLNSSGLVLASSGQTVTVPSGASSFVFATTIASGAAYNVVVQTQPVGQTCSVTNGSGTVVSSAVTNVAVNCSVNTFSLTVGYQGLTASGLVISSGTGQTLSINPGGSGSFATPIPVGTSYSVSVQTQPTGLVCSVSDGNGVTNSGGQSTSPIVTCTPATFTVTANVVGVTGAGMVLTNGAQSFSIPANIVSNINFGPYLNGDVYSITVSSQPSGQLCTVSPPSGVTSSGSLNNVTVSCSSATTVTTLAGTGINGFVNGTGTAASFSLPLDVDVDSSGNVYVADTRNHAIRKITSAGVVNTFAGSGNQGFVNGTGVAASFNNTVGVAVDNSGNVYVADLGNHAIRKITPAGTVSTFAGTGSPGFVNGTGTAASFSFPGGVAVDSSGNVYVGDAGNSVIRKITPAGVVSTLAGSGNVGFVNGTGAAASFNGVNGVVVDSSGNVYVADANNQVIRKITSAGVVSTFAGSGNQSFVNGTGLAASFNNPYGVALDSSGNVYVADSGNSVIRKITPAGVVSTFAGSGNVGFVNGTGTTASFNGVKGVAVDSSGNVYVADESNNAIRKITP